jgi:tellurite resistance protein TerC
MFFLGIKLILHALHENTVPFINSGQHLPIPKISSPLSLGIIAGTLAVTAVVSLYATRARKPVADIERV